MLILMAELTTGKGFIRFIRDTLNRLRQQDEVVYRAYEYLCYTYQYDISIPASLLERLDDKGRFYRLLDKRAAKGLISADKSRPRNLQVGHPIRAEHAARLYGRDPRSVFGEILGVVDVESRVERRFVTHLLREMARRATEPCLPDILKRNATVIEDIQREATISEMIIWHTLYQNLDHQEEAKHCVDMALSKKPTSRWEYFSLQSVCQEQHREAAVLPTFRQWLERTPEDRHARIAYLGLVERYAPEQMTQVIEETSAWLADHPRDVEIRKMYLGLVERKGTDEQAAQAIEETSVWLAEHLQDIEVRKTYLGLVERKGTDEQAAQAIEKTAAWLAQHPRDSEVRRNYLGLVERKGTDEQAAQAIEETSAWLAEHLQDIEVRRTFLGLVERKGTMEQKETTAQQTRQWLTNHPQKAGFPELYAYGCLLLNLEEFEEAARQFRAVLRIHRGYVAARRRLALALNSLGEFRQAENELKHALWWAENVTDYPANILHHDLGVFYLDQERCTEARSEFEKAIEEYPEGFANYWHLGKVLMAQGDYRNAADALQTALDKAPQDLSPPASEEIPALLEEAERLLESCGGN